MLAVFDPPTDRPLGGQWATGHADLEAGGIAANRHCTEAAPSCRWKPAANIVRLRREKTLAVVSGE